MGRRIIQQLVDDLDGTVLEVGEGQTVHFSVDGSGYEIDLSTDNAVKLWEALAPFIEAGRKVPTRANSRRASPKRDVDAIRAWARDNGFDISARGRIPLNVERAYESR